MCGIAGQFSIGEKIDKAEVKKMLNYIRHRGPDGEGFFSNEICSFGMRRLSIIDIDGGWQPLYNEDESIIVCCNGEIYNYLELRKELIEAGHKIRTGSDVEVIVHLYEELGEDFVSRLNGMFAIALLDTRRNRLLLYRDRLGKKPLYYCERNGRLYFASEIKCIIACDGIPRKCNYEALDYLLTYNYIPNNMTSFDGVYKIMPGEYMEVTEGAIRIQKYWELPIQIENVANVRETQAIEMVDALLTDAVKIRLRSDVPVGAFLSGGVDSSTIVAKAARQYHGLQTFSIGFQEKRFDESVYSAEVASLYGTIHTNKIVTYDLFKLIPKTIWLNDDPHGDVSFLPTYILSEVTAEHVKTVLTGDGGDELFGGYTKYLDYISEGFPSIRHFYEKNSVFSKNDKENLYTDFFKKIVRGKDCLDFVDRVIEDKDLKERSSVDYLNILLYLETRVLLEGNNLVKPDRMGMGNSLEARMPLLDYRLVEYVSKLPSNLKIREGVTKYLLKKVASRYLPDSIVCRSKQMFTIPIGEWFKGELKDIAYSVLLEKKTENRNLFNKGYIEYMLNKHVKNEINYTRELRLLMIIELWHRIFIDDFAYEGEIAL